jgi:hypothetical protein
MGTTETPTQRLATILLGRSVHDWIVAQREQGASWRKIADDLKIATDGQIDVTHEAVRGWADEVAA